MSGNCISKPFARYLVEPIEYFGSVAVPAGDRKHDSNGSIYPGRLATCPGSVPYRRLYLPKKTAGKTAGNGQTAEGAISAPRGHASAGPSGGAGVLSAPEDGREIMLERISEVERERGEYRAYIEQWVHEVKTPITALKLLCENNRSPFSRDVLVELENINAVRSRLSIMPEANTQRRTTLSGR